MSTEDRARSLLEDRIAKDPWGELEAYVDDVGRVFHLAYMLNELPASKEAYQDAQLDLRDLMAEAKEGYIARHLADAETEIILNDRQERIDAEVDARIDERYAA